MGNTHEAILLAALALAGWIFYRLAKARARPAGGGAAAPAPVASVPSSVPVIPLAQYAVATDRQWLVLPAGGY